MAFVDGERDVMVSAAAGTHCDEARRHGRLQHHTSQYVVNVNGERVDARG